MEVDHVNLSTPVYQVNQISSDTAKTESYQDCDGKVVPITANVGNNEENVDNTSDSEKNGETKQPSDETMKQTISDINKRLKNTECKFGVHKPTNRITIQIIDKDTQEVVKEIPPEKTLDMIAKVWELAGIMVDEKL